MIAVVIFYLIVVTRTDLSASMLSFDELSTLKDDLDLLHASVTERISTLIQESNTLTNWSSEANKRDKTMVCVLTKSFCLQIIKTYNVESGHIQGH